MEGIALRKRDQVNRLRDLFFFAKPRQLKSSVICQRRRCDYARRRGSLQLKTNKVSIIAVRTEV